jgi:CheY-like chemotaxis protein
MDTLLLVDDDPNDVFLFAHAMCKMGLPNPLCSVADGQAAIDYLQGTGRFADRGKFPFPRLLVMDLKLPYLSGLDVLAWLRMQPSVPLYVVMLSASAQDVDIHEAYRLGADAFLTKPSEPHELERLVKRLCAFWLPAPAALTIPSGQLPVHR